MSYVVGGCNVVAILSMADVVCLEVVSQVSAALIAFSMRHAEGRSLMFGFTISLRSVWIYDDS